MDNIKKHTKLFFDNQVMVLILHNQHNQHNHTRRTLLPLLAISFKNSNL